MIKIERIKLQGFSLVEMAMVLLIIGIIVSSVFKGKDVIESAQIRSVANDVQCLMIACDDYLEAYNNLPGDDPRASVKFPGESNGDGDAQYSTDDANKVFAHLYAAGLINSPSFKAPKIGGQYSLKAENGQLKLCISSGEKGGLTFKQVRLLQAKLIETLGEERANLETSPILSEQNKNGKFIVLISLK